MYDLVVTVNRTVKETYKIKVRADDPEEAQDIAWDFFTTFPNGTVPPETCLKVNEETGTSEVESIEFVRQEPDTSKVFNDDDEPDRIA